MFLRLPYHWLVLHYIEYKSLVFVSLDFYEKTLQCVIYFRSGFIRPNFSSLHVLYMKL